MPLADFDEVIKVNEKLGEPLFVWLQAPAETGKSTLLLDFFRTFCQKAPGVLIPMDQRTLIFEKLRKEEGVRILLIDKDPTVWADEAKIVHAVKEEVPGIGATAIAWDSLSPGFRDKITEAQRVANLPAEERKALTGNPNKASAYQPKAQYMEDAAILAKYGLNTVWVSHEHDGRDKNAKEAVKTSITEVEIKKFRRNLNLWIKTGVENGKYYVQIVWARDRGSLSGKKLYDEVGMFRGMWDRLMDEFLGATVVPWDDVEYWNKPDDAITAAVEQTIEASDGTKIFAFDHVKHATNAYEQVKKDKVIPAMTKEWKAEHATDKLAAPKLMAEIWKQEVLERLEARLKEYESSLGKNETEPQEQPAAPEPEVEEAFNF